MPAPRSDPAPGPFTWDEYMAWEAEQDEKWELVDGYAYRRSDRWHWDPVTGMAGATLAHNMVVANLIRHLGNSLVGGPCMALPSDLKTRSPLGSGRYPDVTVECGKGDVSSLLSTEPRVLIEVLSPSNTRANLFRLLEDYQAVPSVAQIVYLAQDRAFANSWSREPEGWRRIEVEGADALLAFPSLSVSLALREVYDGLPFAAEAAS